MHAESNERTLIIGGGLAGLTLAALLARRGERVTVLERRTTLGGRAATHHEAGHKFNLGPHALYRGGHAKRILDHLGVGYDGATPQVSGNAALYAGKRHVLPGGTVSMLNTKLLSWPGKWQVASVLGTIGFVDESKLEQTTTRDWIDTKVTDEGARALLEALFRLSTYVADLDQLSASVAVSQLKLALAKNVDYIDGGWATLVENLRSLAVAAGAEIRAGVPVAKIEHSVRARGVVLSNGERIEADQVALAVPPKTAATLLPKLVVMERIARTAIPVTAACLDVALDSLPQSTRSFALGIDAPTYLSVHSRYAKLAPEGAASIAVARYGATEATADRAELEACLDQMQPGWRAHLVTQRYLPRMTVVPWLPTAATSGLAGRPKITAAGVDGVWLCGDWVGPRGFLADGSFASAEEVAERIASMRTSVERAA